MADARFRLDDFELYNIARQFRKRVYCLVKQLPPEEKYALACQMRRAALSVANNIDDEPALFQTTLHECCDFLFILDN